MISHSIRTIYSVWLFILGLAIVTGCQHSAQVTEGTVPRRYPYDLPVLQAVDIEVFRDGTSIELVNHTPYTYEDFDLWLNERYVRHVRRLPPGGRLTLSLYEFVDEYSEGLEAGGLFSTNRRDPIVKSEIQTPDGMLGLISIPNPEDNG